MSYPLFVHQLGGGSLWALPALFFRYGRLELHCFRATALGRRLATLAQRLGVVSSWRMIENHVVADSDYNQNFQVRERVIRVLPATLGPAIAQRLDPMFAHKSPYYRRLASLGLIKALAVHMEEITYLDLYGRRYGAIQGRQEPIPLVLTPFAFLRPMADPHAEIMPADAHLVQQPWRWNAPLSPHAWTPFFYYLVYVVRQLRSDWWPPKAHSEAFLDKTGECTHPPKNGPEEPQKAGKHHPSMGRAASAVCWNLNDPKTRNLAWWWESGIDAAQMLALFDRPDIQPTTRHVEILRRHGIQSVALRHGAVGDHPERLLRRHPGSAWGLLKRLTGLLWPTLTMPFRSPMARLIDPMGHLERLRAEEVKGALMALNIKALFHYREVGEDFHTLAAEELDTIRFGFHWSCIDGPCVSTLRTHHVFFLWGRHDAETCLAGGASAPVMLLSGSPFMDFPNPTHRQNAANAAAEMRQAGAETVVALFDNSTVTRRFYQHFLQWALKEPRVGLMVKSKDHCWGAIQRDGLEGLVDAAMASGRVKVLDHEALPSDAASASDFAVGITSLSAVALAALTGCRVLYIDYERLEQTPLAPYATLHHLGIGRCVFHDLPQATEALSAYLEDSTRQLNLGDAGPALTRIDPFRDGRAGARIGGFVKNYMSALKAGMGRQEALEGCVDLYARRWGSWSVIRHPGSRREINRHSNQQTGKRRKDDET